MGKARKHQETGAQPLAALDHGLLLDAAPDALIAIDEELHLVLVNRRAERLFGVARAEVLGHHIDLVVPGCFPASSPGSLMAISEGPHRLHGRRSDGSQFPTEISLSRIELGEHVLVLLAVRDITDATRHMLELAETRAAAEQARTQAERAHARLVDAIESLSDGFMLWDAEDRLVLHNELAARADVEAGSALTPGLTFTEIMRRRALGGRIPEAWGRVEEFVQECLARHRAPDGRPIERGYADGSWLSIREQRTRDGGIVNIVHDITDIKRREAELSAARAAAEAARTEAETANRAKSQFLSSMSHELRTPLNAVIGFAQMLELDRDRRLSEKQREYCRHIVASGQHLVDLVNDVLDLAGIESGKLKVVTERVVVADALQRVLDAMRPLANRSGIAIQADPPAKLPGVRADDLRLRQILINLVSNAIKYNRPGGAVTVSAQRIEADRVRFIVADNGIGIPTSRQHDIFQPFNRAGAEASGIEGAGIGLALSKQLVEAMGGAIGFASEPGTGSRFWIDLPVASGDEAPIAPAALAPVTARAAAGGYKVLYVEDDVSNLRLMDHLLATLPNVVLLSAPNPWLGLELAVAHRPDVIVLDLHLPEMSGFEVLARLKSMAETRDIPILALTAAALPQDVRKGLEAGFFRYLTKPFDMKDFLAAIDEALTLGSRRHAQPDLF